MLKTLLEMLITIRKEIACKRLDRGKQKCFSENALNIKTYVVI